MQRPTRFAHTRYLGDKRTQFVYDVDSLDEAKYAALIDEICNSDVGICFAPDTLPEARNRGYKLATEGKTRRHRKPHA